VAGTGVEFHRCSEEGLVVGASAEGSVDEVLGVWDGFGAAVSEEVDGDEGGVDDGLLP